jgi:dTDP-4-amino-4,6-dideoxygalactose transaminase
MIGEIKPFNSFALADWEALADFVYRVGRQHIPLSGYLAGKERGGRFVCELEDAWAKTFKVKHAIACNSATSGLLAAAFAVGLKPGDHFAVPAMTMSATAAAPMFTGAEPYFVDVEDETFGLVCGPMPDTTKAIFSTNLFGHPSPLGRNEWDKNCGTYLIEDNSQSPFAWAHDRYAGTMGHIGVFSLNVHKPIQCGEGGMVVTDDDRLAARMRAFINHGEHVGQDIGLNLRMPEVCAAIARMQLQRGESIIQGRIDQATAILAAIGDIPGIRPPIVRDGCRHVYYTIPFLLDDKVFAGPRRDIFCADLRSKGVPIVEGYVDPLYRRPAFARFARPCPVAEDLHDRRLFYFENCAHDVTLEQAEQIGAAFRMVAEAVL